MSDLPAFTKLLGVNFLHRSPERSEAELTVREDLCNRRGVLHGGAVMALGDTLGGMTARSGLPDGGGTATIESKTNFFAAVPKGDTAHAVCIPLHRGRTTIVLETRITRGDGKLAAIRTGTLRPRTQTRPPQPAWRQELRRLRSPPPRDSRLRQPGSARNSDVNPAQPGCLALLASSVCVGANPIGRHCRARRDNGVAPVDADPYQLSASDFTAY